MLHVILYAIVPIIVVMSVGFIAGKKGAFSGGDAKAFNKVVLDGALDVEFSQASRGGVAIKGRKSIVDNVKVKVKNQTLYLSLDEKDWFRVDHSEKADIYLRPI